jgi:hypothetical protein
LSKKKKKKKKKEEEDKIEETRSNFFDLLFSPVFDKFNGAFNLEIAIIVVKSKKITRQDKEIAICKTNSSGIMYDSFLLLCVLQTTPMIPFIDIES